MLCRDKLYATQNTHFQRIFNAPKRNNVQQKHLNTLEFPKILERLASYAAFSAGKKLAAELQPTPYFSQAQNWQAETTEAEQLLSVKVNIGVGGARDVRPNVARCKRGLILTPRELMEIRQTLISARELSRTIVRLADTYPRLADIAQRIEPCLGVVNAVGHAVDDNDEIKSSASPALARIRREMDIAHARLMEKLNRMIGSSGISHYLQENLITRRAGRYVLPIKAEFKGRIKGVVHDQSASGATIFVEPLATVELNNKWRRRQLDEEDEIRKILAGLCYLVGEQGEFIEHSVAALAGLDLVFAKAKYAHAIDAVEPALFGIGKNHSNATGENIFKLMTARHPLLHPKTVVPIDAFLAEDTHMLVITGPNTGGKTVSLKTVGLLAAMAQAGLRIPADEGSALPVFEQIFADIGDEQSIEQSLSTFSAHMTNVVQILKQCDENSLVIFDELGAGTDPIEGSALAQSILTNLLGRTVTTFVATHYSELKAYAHTTPGVANASMEFNVETLSPTFRLRIGIPGASNAFTIAQRLGLPAHIINVAQGLVGEDARQVEAMLSEIKAQTEAARNVRQLAEAERREAEAVKHQIQQQLDNIDAERRAVLNSARADARREIKAARERIRALEAEVQAALKNQQSLPVAPAQETTNNDKPVAQAVETQLAAIEAEVTPVSAPEPPQKTTPPKKKARGGRVRTGDTVFVPQFATVGEVVGVQGHQADVQMGRFRATVLLQELELKEAAEPLKPPEPQRQVKTPAEVDSPGLELDLRGQVSEEAIMNMDQYLDKAYLAHLPWVRIIHGRGSGVLRQVVRQELHRHPMVSSYRAGKEGEGGDGVTVAKLAVN